MSEGGGSAVSLPLRQAPRGRDGFAVHQDHDLEWGAGEPANRRDGIFSPELLMSVAEPGAAPGETVQAAFDFAVRTA